MTETVKFELGQIVYSVICREDFRGQVTGICFRSHGVLYLVTWSNDLVEKWHSDIELTTERNFEQPKTDNTK